MTFNSNTFILTKNCLLALLNFAEQNFGGPAMGFLEFIEIKNKVIFLLINLGFSFYNKCQPASLLKKILKENPQKTEGLLWSLPKNERRVHNL